MQFRKLIFLDEGNDFGAVNFIFLNKFFLDQLKNSLKKLLSTEIFLGGNFFFNFKLKI